jgi:hypothetical protein
MRTPPTSSRVVGGPHTHPTRQPIHAVLLRQRSNDDRAVGHPLEAKRVDERAPVEEQPLHRSVGDQGKIALTAKVADQPPVVRFEPAAGRH